MKGKILVFTGDGKGKTTSAMGTAVRAAGHGKKIIIIQFLKKGNYGEIKALKNVEGIEIYQFGKGKFVIEKEEEDYILAEKGLKFAMKKLKEEPFMLILDEINVAISMGLLKEEEVLNLLDNRGETHVILTGRNASRRIMEMANLITEMENIRHYYDAGEKAIEGLEY